jgi:hypothetical protein
MTIRTNFLEPRRLGLLFKRDFLIGYRGILITMAASAGFIMLVSVLANLGRSSQFVHMQLFMPLMYIGGFVFTSLAFRELHQGEQSYFYLNLPASSLEKLISKLLVTSVGYAIGALVFYSLVSLLSEGVNRLIFGYGHPLFNPVSREVLFSVAVYLVTQSIFLLGSVYFRKLAFLKTVIAWNVFAIGTAILVGLTTWLIFRGVYLEDGLLRPEARAALESLAETGRFEALLEDIGRGFWLTLKILFWGVLAPVCWIITYFRLRETEV